jgi:hypothetical protein
MHTIPQVPPDHRNSHNQIQCGYNSSDEYRITPRISNLVTREVTFDI